MQNSLYLLVVYLWLCSQTCAIATAGSVGRKDLIYLSTPLICSSQPCPSCSARRRARSPWLFFPTPLTRPCWYTPDRRRHQTSRRCPADNWSHCDTPLEAPSSGTPLRLRSPPASAIAARRTSVSRTSTLLCSARNGLAHIARRSLSYRLLVLSSDSNSFWRALVHDS
ncbi:hypothetical protein C2E23DRAFT_576006 [Lenzites betulinus]|nr:hypothetical protein C2E23DRAFT_576006 [Lenzites betulinus]